MLDPAYGGSLAAGLMCGCAILVAGFGPPRIGPAGGDAHLEVSAGIRLRCVELWGALAAGLERAGWRASPRQVAALGLALGLGCGLACGALGFWLAPAGFAAGCGIGLFTLSSAIQRRRRRLAGELVPLLELFTLELSSGGSAQAALGSVTMQVDAELAADLRRMLIASQVSGSQSFEARLLDYSERIRIPALGTLATILGANRDFGTGATQGVRALATDLRRAQRRDLITHSRKALNHVLLPAAVGVLLPFLGVLMFPAVSVLQRSLH